MTNSMNEVPMTNVLCEVQHKHCEPNINRMDQYFFCGYCAVGYCTEKTMLIHEVQCNLAPRLLVEVTLDKASKELFSKKLDEWKQSLAREEKKGRSEKDASKKSTRRKARDTKAQLSESTNVQSVSTRRRRNYNKLYYCFRCAYSTRFRVNLVRHMLVHADIKQKKFSCSNCVYSTNYKENLLKHVVIHNEQRPRSFFCDKCTYAATNKSNLVHHMSVHNKKIKKQKKISCTICDFKTYNNSYLRLHTVRAHSADFKKHSCVHCKKCFKNKQSLGDHMYKIHKDTMLVAGKIWSCPSCSFKSAIKTNFTAHMNAQHPTTNSIMYKCSICEYSSYYKGNYTQHLKTHSETKDYVCNSCFKGFCRRDQLENHIVTYHGDNDRLMAKVSSKIYNCLYCNYRTIVINMLKYHLKSKHKNKT